MSEQRDAQLLELFGREPRADDAAEFTARVMAMVERERTSRVLRACLRIIALLGVSVPIAAAVALGCNAIVEAILVVLHRDAVAIQLSSNEITLILISIAAASFIVIQRLLADHRS